MKVIGSPFQIDWKDKAAVIAYAIKLGKGQVVFKHPDRDNYNITFSEMTTRYELSWVVYKT